jgi:hypothetical protein
MEVVGAVTLVTSGALVVAVAVAWARIPRALGDALVACGGAGLAIGGLLVLGGAATSAWIIAPPVVAVLSVVHVRLLVAPGGPMRI